MFPRIASVIVSWVLVVSLFGGAVARAGGPAVSEPHIYDDGAGNTMPYRLFLPPKVEPEREYPLVLFLHGAGECGTDNLRQTNSNINGLVAATQSERFTSYLVAPQVECNTNWLADRSATLAAGIVDEVANGHAVDQRRIYVTGLSMGGFGTFEQLFRFPEKYAAGVPIASGIPGAMADEYAAVIWPIPIWVFHGDNDPVVSVEWSRNVVRALRAAGGDPLYTEYPGVQHNSWTVTYTDNADVLYPWLFNWILRGPQAEIRLSEESGAAPFEICVSASDSTSGEDGELVGFDWDFGDGGSDGGLDVCHTYTEAGVYEILLRVTNDSGFWAETRAPVVVHCPPGGDVDPWVAEDIGDPLLRGSALLEDGGSTLAICAGGKLLSGLRDTVHFVHGSTAEDIVVSGRIGSLEAPLGAPVGVMVRESLAPDAKSASLTLVRGSTGNLLRFRVRRATATVLRTSGSMTAPADLPDVWLRLERKRDEIIASTSADGSTWEEVGRDALPDLAETVHAGWVAAGGLPLRTEIREIAFVEAPAGGLQLAGDCNQDGTMDISDGVCLLQLRFLLILPDLPCGNGTFADPANRQLLDFNGDTEIDISDAISVFSYLFLGGPPAFLGTECVPIRDCPDVCVSE